MQQRKTVGVDGGNKKKDNIPPRVRERESGKEKRKKNMAIILTPALHSLNPTPLYIHTPW